jgi:hypothetical protein
MANLKEIRNRITDGDLRRGLGEAILAQRKQTLPEKRSRVMRVYWQKVKSEPITILKRNLQDQLNRIRNRHYASKNLQDATKEQNRWNYMEAKRIMQDLLEQAKNGVNIPHDVQIASLIKPQPKE